MEIRLNTVARNGAAGTSVAIENADLNSALAITDSRGSLIRCLPALIIWAMILTRVPGVYAAGDRYEVANAWQTFKDTNGAGWKVKWDQQLRTPSLLEGRSQPLIGNPEQAVRDFLKANANLFLLRSDLSDLSLESPTTSPAGTHLLFKQSYMGLPVFNGSIAVHLNPHGEIFLIRNAYIPDQSLRDLDLRPSVSIAEADKLAESDYSREPPRGFQSSAKVHAAPLLGIYRTSTGIRLAYEVTLAGRTYVIDAQSGQTLRRIDLLKFDAKDLLSSPSVVSGSVKVFEPNPVYSLGTQTLPHAMEINYTRLNPAYIAEALPRITQTTDGAGKKTYSLDGPFVDIEAITDGRAATCGIDPGYAGLNLPPVESRPQFTYKRGDPRFQSAIAYRHIDRNAGYVTRLGFSLSNISVDAHAQAVDNSFYCSEGNLIAFGDDVVDGAGNPIPGGVEDAEDEDVILHEYGHYLQEHLAPGVYDGVCGSDSNSPGSENAAMGEGFGDYWAFSNRRPINGLTIRGFDQMCFAPWNGITEAPDPAHENHSCVRRLDSPKIYPKDKTFECHADGEIWSRTLVSVFSKIGKAKTDDLALTSAKVLLGEPFAPTFCDGAKALLIADGQLFGSTDRTGINKVLGKRGIAGNFQAANLVITSPTYPTAGFHFEIVNSGNCPLDSTKHDIHLVTATRGDTGTVATVTTDVLMPNQSQAFDLVLPSVKDVVQNYRIFLDPHHSRAETSAAGKIVDSPSFNPATITAYFFMATGFPDLCYNYYGNGLWPPSVSISLALSGHQIGKIDDACGYAYEQWFPVSDPLGATTIQVTGTGSLACQALEVFASGINGSDEVDILDTGANAAANYLPFSLGAEITVCGLTGSGCFSVSLGPVYSGCNCPGCPPCTCGCPGLPPC